MKVELTEDFVMEVLRQELSMMYHISCNELVEAEKRYFCSKCRPEAWKQDIESNKKFLDAVDVIFNAYGIDLDEGEDEG